MADPPQSGMGRTVIVMLDNQCASPCYGFDTDQREVHAMSPEILDEVLEWVSHLQPSPPDLLYMVGAPQALGEEVREVLADIAGCVICAPLPRTAQEQAGLPFAATQLVVFPSLAAFEKDPDLLGGRAGVVHLGPEEISRWFQAVRGRTTEVRLRFRPKHLPGWTRSDLRAYLCQRSELETLQQYLTKAGVSVGWELHAVSRCPARRSLATIGPDGLCYPCPTFYYAGQTAGLGALKTLAGDRVFLPDGEPQCRFCQSEGCEVCLFYASGQAGRGEVTACDFPTEKRNAAVPPHIRTAPKPSPSRGGGEFFRKSRKAWAVRRERLRRALAQKARIWATRPSRSRTLYYRLIHAPFVVKRIPPPLSFRESPLIQHSRELGACVHEGLPEIQEYHEVFFVPGLRAVYDDHGVLIRSSVSRGGVGAIKSGTPPERIDAAQAERSPVVDKALFGGIVSCGHFGHFLLESLSRLWPFAIPSMAQEVSDCDILYWSPDGKTGDAVLRPGRVILASLGIDAQVRLLDQPVLIRKLIIPGQATILKKPASEIYPIFRTLLKTAGDRITRMYRQSRKEEYTENVYLSRSRLSFRQRNCVNEKRLEALLQTHGFGIFHPQEMSLADQIGLWDRAQIVVGTWGSALHTMLFSEVSQKTILCLTDGNHEGAFTGVDRICGADTKYVRCMYPHPFCMKRDVLKDRIIDVPSACQAILQYI
jgi:hypothetical protein